MTIYKDFTKLLLPFHFHQCMKFCISEVSKVLSSFAKLKMLIRSLNPLKPKFIQVIFKNSVTSPQKLHCDSTVNISQLILFRK